MTKSKKKNNVNLSYSVILTVSDFSIFMIKIKKIISKKQIDCVFITFTFNNHYSDINDTLC